MSPPRWQLSPSPVDVSDLSLMLDLSSSVDPARIAVRACAALADTLPLEIHERVSALKALIAAHGANTLPATHNAGIPPRLWEKVLKAGGLRRSVGSDVLPPAIRSDDLPPPAVRRGRWTEWFALADHPGGRHGDELWAWGAVTEDPQQGPGRPEDLSPRVAWAPGPTGWKVHPTLAGFAERCAPGLPHLNEGPGPLLAAVVDSLAALHDTKAFKDRDRAVMWAALLAPLLAPARVSLPAGHTCSPFDLLPDYRTLIAFHTLHPRVQLAIGLLDQLANLLAAEDQRGLAQLGEALGAEDRSSAGVAGAVLTTLQRALKDPSAQANWDSGLGYLVFRTFVRELGATDGEEFLARLEDLLHGELDRPKGNETVLGRFAEQIRHGFTVALSFPGTTEARYVGGPAALQAADLAWLKWTDPDYLAA